jgi:cytochrome c-type biogenesis protein
VLSSDQAAASRRRIIAHAVAFVVGFTLAFTFLGASVGLIGSSVQQQLDTLTRIGGVVLIVFGMQMSGLINIPFLNRTYQVG